MSPGERDDVARERAIRDIHRDVCGCKYYEEQGMYCAAISAAMPAYDAGASRLAEVEVENEVLKGALLNVRGLIELWRGKPHDPTVITTAQLVKWTEAAVLDALEPLASEVKP